VVATLGVPAAKVDVAAPGCDFDRFKPLPAAEIAAFRARKGLPEHFWLYVGTLEPRKNLPTLLEAYADLPERPPLLLGGGKGWQYDEIFATIARRNLEGDVHWLGYLPA
jgi:glycosyltransferase involved in cell wall biosynthesis